MKKHGKLFFAGLTLACVLLAAVFFAGDTAYADYQHSFPMVGEHGAGHPTQNGVSIEATCKEPKYQSGIWCVTCNAWSIPPTKGDSALNEDNHKILKGINLVSATNAVLPVTATCTKESVEGHLVCSACGDLLDSVNQEPTTLEALTGEKDPTNHTGTKEPLGYPATCCKTGVETYYFWNCCGAFTSDEAGKNIISAPVTIHVDPNAHSAVRTRVTATEATCTATGNIGYWMCQNGCGAKLTAASGGERIPEGDEVLGKDMTAHTGITRVTRFLSTCTKDGLGQDMDYCADCKNYVDANGNVDNSKILKAWGHAEVPVEPPLLAPTCKEAGIRKIHCANCDWTVYRIISKAHVKSEGAVKKAATCSKNGEMGYICTVCEEPFTEAIPATREHLYKLTLLEATCYHPMMVGNICTVCGVIEYGKLYPVMGVDGLPSSPVGHKYVNRVVAEPTCTATGVSEKICQFCKQSFEFIQIPAAHRPEALPAVEATCKTTGLTEGSVCTACGVTLVKQTETPLTPHTPVDVEAAPGDCVTDSRAAGTKCEICQTLLSGCEVVAASGHTVVKVESVAATCTEAGLSEGAKCSVCTTVLVEQTVVNALGHDAVADEAVAATMFAPGKTAGTHCSACGETIVAQETIPRLGAQTNRTAAIRETADDAVTPFGNIAAGAPVTLNGGAVNGYYSITANGVTGYVRLNAISPLN